MNIGKAIGWTIGAFVLMLLMLLIGVLCETVKADTAQLKGTTNTEDAWIYSTSNNNNYGGDTDLEIDGSPVKWILLRPKNVASVLGGGATITSCICSLYCYQEIGGADDIYIYRVFKPWVEGTYSGQACFDNGWVTFSDWACDDYEWTSEGVGCANDDGVDNSADNGACDDASRRDRKATAEDNTSVDAAGWYSWTISNALAQAWYDGTANEEGILFKTSGTGLKYFYSSEYANAAYHPRFYFVYTTAAAEGQVIIIH